ALPSNTCGWRAGGAGAVLGFPAPAVPARSQPARGHQAAAGGSRSFQPALLGGLVSAPGQAGASPSAILPKPGRGLCSLAEEVPWQREAPSLSLAAAPSLRPGARRSARRSPVLARRPLIRSPAFAAAASLLLLLLSPARRGHGGQRQRERHGRAGATAAARPPCSRPARRPRAAAVAAGRRRRWEVGGIVISPFRLEELTNRLASLQQENKVLKIELETYKLKCKALQEENRDLRKASVTIQARAEQEEEFISNTLFKKIQALQKEKETLAVNYEKEEEFLTNELSRKLMQLQHEKAELEQHLEQEQEFQVNKLMKKIKKLENDTISKQLTLEQLRREKIDLENTLEQEQEALVNRLWKRMDKLEAEKRILQEKLDQPVSAPPSPRDISMEIDSPENMMRHIRFLKNEVERLKKQLRAAQLQHSEKMAQYLEEERHMREENLRLQRKLQREMERREALCRQLSESESSLEMDDERYFNEMSAQGLRPRTVSSPIPYTPSPSSSRPISPGEHMSLAILVTDSWYIE
uniref:Coiled-coil domain containing 6 n=1 Tax=Macaca fascicularis TaxID=9541 RepID=A0A2K5VSC8_MACFA